MNTIRVVLPKQYDLVVGDTFQLFYRGIIEAPNPFCYDIVATCKKGKNFPRYFEFTPDEEGKYTLIVSVYDAGKQLLGWGETTLLVTEAREPEQPLRILCIGDSLTAGGQWVEELQRRLIEKGGEPAGNGFSGIQFIGTCKKDIVAFEGYGGWRWDSYLSASKKGLWIVTGKHDKVEEDQHSVWQDEAGKFWKIETITEDSLKLLPYQQEQLAETVCGSLVHEKNAVHEAPITFTDIIKEAPSPFLNKEKGIIDFVWYCEENGFAGIDGVYIFLGWNCVDIDVSTVCREQVEKAKNMIDTIHRDYPQAWIRILGLQVPSVNGGTGSSYGAEIPYCDDYGLTRYVMELNLAYESVALEEAYKNFVEFINLSGQFDSDYNMPYKEKCVNVRSRRTEVIGTNGVHPAKEGYMQIADAVYRNIIKSIQSQSQS